jgi:hypothetical protein
MGQRNPPPWDIYVDERKGAGAKLGFLAVPNTPSFMHKLHRCRENALGDGRIVAQEVHWSKPRGDTIELAKHWMYRVFQHKGTEFCVADWPRDQAKEFVILKFLAHFKQRKSMEARSVRPFFNMVVIMDFDSTHAATRIQNTVRETGQITRCYHFDSRRNDCLQCVDLMLGAYCYLQEHPMSRMMLPELESRRANSERLTNAEIRALLAGELGKLMESNAKDVYSLDA